MSMGTEAAAAPLRVASSRLRPFRRAAEFEVLALAATPQGLWCDLESCEWATSDEDGQPWKLAHHLVMAAVRLEWAGLIVLGPRTAWLNEYDEPRSACRATIATNDRRKP